MSRQRLWAQPRATQGTTGFSRRHQCPVCRRGLKGPTGATACPSPDSFGTVGQKQRSSWKPPVEMRLFSGFPRLPEALLRPWNLCPRRVRAARLPEPLPCVCPGPPLLSLMTRMKHIKDPEKDKEKFNKPPTDASLPSVGKS